LDHLLVGKQRSYNLQFSIAIGMKSHTYLAIFIIAASIAIGTASIANPALADKSSGQNGLDKADENVHENTPGGFAGDQDIRFHEGTCQGGHPVDIPEGCDNPLITDPGNSDDHRKDK
jgi:hypothetical protein